MYIILFILLIIPGIIATHIYLKDSCETNFFNIVYQIAKFTYAIMFISFSAMLFRGWGEFAFERISVIFAVKYLALSLVLSVSLPLLNKFWKNTSNKYK